MKMSPFFEQIWQKIKEDWIAKIVCFGLAMLLYLFYQAVSLERKSFVLPLTTHNTGKMTNAGVIQRSVRVTVRGKAQDISLISERDFEAFIDFSRYTKEGTYDVPIQLKTADNLLAIDPLEVRFFPDSISVDMEALKHEYVPISAVFYEEPRYGFAVRDHTITPSVVRISGPRSAVDALKSVDTEGISLANKNASFIAPVKLENDSALIRIDDPGVVNVSVFITRKETSSTFTVPVAVANLRDDLSATPRQHTLTVRVSGTQLDLEKISADDFAAVADCAQISHAGEVTLPVTVTPPPRVYVDEADNLEITLDITAKEPAGD
ncbi:MAG: hypothetical protein Pg6C_08880 [Treponemataceae bacterium]|nr:MAG: hypothetical protein Pg6C_08880 [Treponemataceae bacterium]